MWRQELPKNIVPVALTALCTCGARRLNNVRNVLQQRTFSDQQQTSSTTHDAAGSGDRHGRGKKKQRIPGSCYCGGRGFCSFAISSAKFPLTANLLYRTHPAFKTSCSTLSLHKRHKRSNFELPLPRFLFYVASSLDDRFQSVFNNGSETKGQCDQATKINQIVRSITTASTQIIAMPSTTELNQGNLSTSSPSKRKLTTSSSPLKNSPQKKILKEKQPEKEVATMPSSGPSSPRKENNGTLKTASPLKNLDVRREIGFEQEVVSKLFFKKLSDKAHAPSKGSKFAAGFDLKSAYEYTVPKRGSCLVKTDIQIKLPPGTYGRVAPRSGLALKNKIDVGAGVIDQDYRGNIGVILFNHADEDFHVAEGDRVAQLICEKIEYPEAEEVESLDETERGEGGFGSTGVKSQ